MKDVAGGNNTQKVTTDMEVFVDGLKNIFRLAWNP